AGRYGPLAGKKKRALAVDPGLPIRPPNVGGTGRAANSLLRSGGASQAPAAARGGELLTAKPLYEIFRAVVVEVVDDAISLKKAKTGRVFDRDPPLVVDLMEKALQFASAYRDVFLGVMGTIADEYNTLVNKRNNLLHATWFIGFQGSGDPSCSESYVRKYATTKQGLTTVELPKNAPELRELSKRCEVTRNWIAWLHSCLRGSSYIRERFEYHGKKWWLVTPGGHKTTLP